MIYSNLGQNKFNFALFNIIFYKPGNFSKKRLAVSPRIIVAYEKNHFISLALCYVSC